MSNPFMGQSAAPAAPVERLELDPILGAAVHHSGPQLPPLTSQFSGRVPTVTVTSPASVWLQRLHGGCGSSTLANLLTSSDGLTPAEVDAWPMTHHPVTLPVVLVARTHAVGLAAARTALTAWGAGVLPTSVALVGLVMIADGPKPSGQGDEIKALASMAPKLWHIGWMEQWRQLLPHQERSASLRLRRTVQTIRQSATSATTRRDLQ